MTRRLLTALPLVTPLAALLSACSDQPAPTAPPPCPADAVLSAAAPALGTPVEATPAGHCLSMRAEAGDVAAQLRLGDFYRDTPGTMPLIDRRGRQIHWYRMAADKGSPAGAWEAVQLIDINPDIQVPNDALAYLFVAVKAGIPDAGEYLTDQWQDGRIDPGKLYRLRQWLAKPGVLPEDQRRDIIDGLNAPADELLEE
jgi:hypothetical protein